MSGWHGHDQIDLSAELLDRQIVDPDGAPFGKVDDVELELRDDGVIEVTAILTGTSAWRRRLDTRSRLRPGRFFGRSRPPTRIPLSEIENLDSTVSISHAAAESMSSPAERWLRRKIVDRIPGAGDAH